MTKLSVIVPFYNVREFAADTLGSLARNASPTTEFLLVDDQATDGTGQILDRWAERLPGARVLRHEKNKGLAAARNTGLAAAAGEYVTFLDGDDWYAPGYLDKLVEAIDTLGVDFVRTDHVRATGTERKVVRAPGAPRGKVLRARDAIAPAHRETMVDYPNAWTSICRRSFIEETGLSYDEHLRTCEDRPWTWQLYLRAETFAVVGLLGIFYRRGVTTSLTQIGDERQLDFIPAHDLTMQRVLADPEADRYLPKIVRTFCAMIAYHMGNSVKYESQVRARLKRMSADALRRMPQDVLDKTLLDMDHERARLLRRLRRRAGEPAA